MFFSENSRLKASHESKALLLGSHWQISSNIGEKHDRLLVAPSDSMSILADAITFVRSSLYVVPHLEQSPNLSVVGVTLPLQE